MHPELLHTETAMAIYHVLNHVIGMITLIYLSLAIVRMRPARRKEPVRHGVVSVNEV